MARAERVVALN